MAEFLMKPKIDFAFKEIMTDEKARIGFLSAMLKLNPEDIKETTLLNTSLRKTYEDDKLGILDVRVLMNDDTEIDIEVQLSELSVWAERSLFYLAKMYTEQINPGDSYNKFKKCVSISILDFKLFDDTKNFYSCFHIAEDNRHSLYTDKMEFHVLELPKLPEQPKNDSDNILLWAKFINAERKENLTWLQIKILILKVPTRHYRLSAKTKKNDWNTKHVKKPSVIITSSFLKPGKKAGQKAGKWEKNA